MFTLINEGVTFALALFVFGSVICRIDIIKLRRLQYRYVAPFALTFAFAVAPLLSILGGDQPDWYMPLGLLAMAIFLFNSRHEWRDGPPAHMLRDAFLSEAAAEPGNGWKRLRWQNVATGGLVAISLGAAAIGAGDGRGNPLQIYSAHADPIVVNPLGELDIVYRLRRVRVCSGYVDRFLLNPKTEQTVQTFERQPIGSLKPAGKVEQRVHLQLDDLPAGNYVFRAVIYSQCPDQSYVQHSPDVPITVAPTPEPANLLAAPIDQPAPILVPPVTPADIPPGAAVPPRRAPPSLATRTIQKPEPAAPLPDLGAAVRDANRRMAGEGAR